jgi:hypothetical protein
MLRVKAAAVAWMYRRRKTTAALGGDTQVFA